MGLSTPRHLVGLIVEILRDPATSPHGIPCAYMEAAGYVVPTATNAMPARESGALTDGELSPRSTLRGKSVHAAAADRQPPRWRVGSHTERVGIVMRQTLVVILILWVLAPCVAEAQETMLGTAPLQLGMSQADAAATLGARYRVEKFGRAEDVWRVWTKADRPPYELIGSVNFTNGRLTNVSKVWVHQPDSQDSFSVGEALAGALASLLQADAGTAAVTITTHRDPGATTLTIALRAHGKVVIFSMVDRRRSHEVAVGEQFEELRSTPAAAAAH